MSGGGVSPQPGETSTFLTPITASGRHVAMAGLRDDEPPRRLVRYAPTSRTSASSHAAQSSPRPGRRTCSAGSSTWLSATSAVTYAARAALELDTTFISANVRTSSASLPSPFTAPALLVRQHSPRRQRRRRRLAARVARHRRALVRVPIPPRRRSLSLDAGPPRASSVTRNGEASEIVGYWYRRQRSTRGGA